MDFRQMIKGNLAVIPLAVLVIAQIPFTVRHFLPDPPVVVSDQKPQSADKPKPAPARIPPALKSRDDPFVLLPGMKDENRGSTAQPGGQPPIFQAFRDPSGAGVPVETPPDVRPINVEVKPLPPASVTPPASASPSTSSQTVKLDGIVRYGGRSMAVFRLPDRSTVHTGEGERVPGTDCSVQTILPNRICIKRGGQRAQQDWVAVGEEWRT